MKFIHTRSCGSQTTPCFCVKSHGYVIREQLKPGDLVTLFDDFTVSQYGETVMLPGMVGKLEYFSNDGFAGISASVTVNGKRLSHISAGQLRKADDGTAARQAVQAERARRIVAVAQAQAHLNAWEQEHAALLNM